MSLAASLTGVSKSFKGVPVLRDVTIEFPKGEIVGIQGPNGSGKSVLFKLLCGFVFPDSGEVFVDAAYRDPGDSFPTGAGVIIDRPGYLPGLTGQQNLWELARIRKRIGRSTVIEAMQRVGLDPDAKQRMRNYSLGMKQKVAIAQAFMEGQQLLLLDEAFNGLDATSVAATRELLLELHAEGRTIIITSHNQADIDAVCNQVWRIDDHKLARIR